MEVSRIELWIIWDFLVLLIGIPLSYCVKHLRFWIYTEIVLIGMGIAKDFTVTWYSWRNRGLNMEICAFLFEISMFCWIFPLFPLFHGIIYVFSVEYSLDMLRCWLKVLVLVHEVMILSYKNIHIAAVYMESRLYQIKPNLACHAR